ncbi:MAG: hypothetical protein JSV91_09855 [Phycisphaerales bacterium]|nr:MAG: hypothetical protein JSV91_09855 [Phycisphaerales bacterium]
MCETSNMEAEASAPGMFKIRLSDGQEFGPAVMAQILQWGREGRVPIDSLIVPEDGSPIRSVLAQPQLKGIIQAPPTVSPGVIAPTPRSSSALIPTGNPMALIGYYLAVASLIPGLGILGPVAFVLGILGLRHAARFPEAKGKVHAWIAIIGGTLISLVYIMIIIVVVIANLP